MLSARVLLNLGARILIRAHRLAGLLASLNLSTATQRVLGRAACDVSSIPQFADAGWELQRRLEDLQVDGNACLQNM